MPSSSDQLPEYEGRLLAALAYFLGRDPDAQARACLCMYLRQAEPRIMAQVKYYAHRLTAETGQLVDAYDLLDRIALSPDSVTEALPYLGQVHDPAQIDIFSDQPDILSE